MKLRFLIFAFVVYLASGPFAFADEIYVSEYSGVIKKFTAAGSSSVFADSGYSTFGLAFGPDSSLYAASYNRTTLTKFNASGVGASFAGGLSNPFDIAFDSSGNLFVANSGSPSVKKITPGGGTTTFATANLDYPFGVAVDNAGNV